MAKRICNNCQYWRQQNWCSNSKSHLVRLRTSSLCTCAAYVQRGQRAPLALRAANWVLKVMRGVLP
jgi:hypothetical protein